MSLKVFKAEREQPWNAFARLISRGKTARVLAKSMLRGASVSSVNSPKLFHAFGATGTDVVSLESDEDEEDGDQDSDSGSSESGEGVGAGGDMDLRAVNSAVDFARRAEEGEDDLAEDLDRNLFDGDDLGWGVEDGAGAAANVAGGVSSTMVSPPVPAG